MLFSRKLGEGGQGVVLLHGFMGSGSNVRRLAQLWSERDPSLFFSMPDLTGHGRSPALPPGADLFTLARDVIATARANGIQGPLRIVGHSLGGRVGLAAILLAPTEVEEVVVLDVAPGPIDPARVESGRVLAIYRGAPAEAKSRDEMRAYFSAQGLSSDRAEWLLTNLVREGDALRWRVDREALAALHQRTSSAELWPALEKGVRIHFIRGGASPFVSDEDVARIERAGHRVETVEGADHYLHVTHAEEVARRLDEHFRAR